MDTDLNNERSKFGTFVDKFIDPLAVKIQAGFDQSISVEPTAETLVTEHTDNSEKSWPSPVKSKSN